MVWLDQPAGVGFSWGTTDDKDEADAARDAYDFLQTFFKAHAELQARPFFIVGESYGGHYSPALSVSSRRAATPATSNPARAQNLRAPNTPNIPSRRPNST